MIIGIDYLMELTDDVRITVDPNDLLDPETVIGGCLFTKVGPNVEYPTDPQIKLGNKVRQVK